MMRGFGGKLPVWDGMMRSRLIWCCESGCAFEGFYLGCCEEFGETFSDKLIVCAHRVLRSDREVKPSTSFFVRGESVTTPWESLSIHLFNGNRHFS